MIIITNMLYYGPHTKVSHPYFTDVKHYFFRHFVSGCKLM